MPSEAFFWLSRAAFSSRCDGRVEVPSSRRGRGFLVKEAAAAQGEVLQEWRGRALTLGWEER